MEISVKAAYSPTNVPALLSNTSSIDAWPTGLRPPEPLKMTSVMDSPRRFLADDSPITQRTASMMLDLPQPLGPTTAPRLLGKLTVVGSTKDLNPANLIHFNRIGPCHSLSSRLASVESFATFSGRAGLSIGARNPQRAEF